MRREKFKFGLHVCVWYQNGINLLLKYDSYQQWKLHSIRKLFLEWNCLQTSKVIGYRACQSLKFAIKVLKLTSCLLQGLFHYFNNPMVAYFESIKFTAISYIIFIVCIICSVRFFWRVGQELWYVHICFTINIFLRVTGH